jgi:hypothetical protein
MPPMVNGSYAVTYPKLCQNEGAESAVTFKDWRDALHSGEIESGPLPISGRSRILIF